MKNNKKFTFYDNLKTSENLKQRILEKTFNNKKTNFTKINKLVYTVSLILLVSIISCSIVFATIYTSTTTFNKKIDESGTYHQGVVLKDPVEIKDDGTFKCGQGMTLIDIENKLNMHFADNIDKTSTINNCNVTINNEGKIEAVYLRIDDYIDYNEENIQMDEDDNNKDWFKSKHITLNISFMTQNASLDVKEKFNHLYDNETSEKKKVTETKLNTINAIAYSYTPYPNGAVGSTYNTKTPRYYNYVIFTYNNIVYFFNGFKVNCEDIIKTIE